MCPGCGETDGAKLLGNVVRGVYDGVLFWHCQSCDTVWARDFGDWRGKQDKADLYAARFRDELEARKADVGPDA